MEDFSESSDEENTHPLTKPNRKSRTPAQQDAFKKAQQVRVENAKFKKTRIDEIKETIELENEFAKLEEREAGELTKLQQQRKDIETKILSEVKAMKDKKQEAELKRQARRDEARAKDKARDELKAFKALQKAGKLELPVEPVEHIEPVEPVEPAPTNHIATLKKPKKEPKIIYESESEEEVVIIKKKKKPPKIIYQDADDDEIVENLNKLVSKKSTPIIEKQPQIIKTNQIRFF